MNLTRRDLLQLTTATAGLVLAGRARAINSKNRAQVIVVGGGFGGATAARYLNRWGGNRIAVTLIERNKDFVSCPISNLVLGGSKTLADLTRGYGKLAGEGVRIVHDTVTRIDPGQRRVSLSKGDTLSYDRLVVSPGVEFMWDAIPAMANPAAQERVLHGWKAGPQTVALRRQLEAMPDGGVFVISIPTAPYRCPPGPYERACQVAAYFTQAKRRSKVIVLDANAKIVSKPALFEKAFKERYAGMIEYRPDTEVIDVDVNARLAKTEFESVKADVLNIVPPQRAADIARETGLITANERWCEIDWRSMESIARPHIHVLGDAVMAAPLMPKSGHIANQHAKIAAAAILSLLNDEEVNPQPVAVNTCYSFVDDTHVIHVASVHRYDEKSRTLQPVEGSGGVSDQASEIEGVYAMAWAQNIWADMLG